MLDLEKPWPLALDWKGWAVSALAFALLLVLVYWIDVPLSIWAQGWPQPVEEFFLVVTDLGLSEWYLVPALLFFVLSGSLALLIPKPVARRALWQMTGLWAFMFVGVGFPGLLTSIFKRLVGRGRPELFEQYGPLNFQALINDWTYQSFPSGHSTTAFALCFTVGFIAPRWFPWMLALAVLIGFSRVVVGAHYPTDALAGALVGMLGAYLVRNYFASRGWVFRRLPDGRIEMRDLVAVRRLFQRRA